MRRLALAVVVAALAQPVIAQPKTDVPEDNAIVLRRVTLVVADMDRALGFYRDALGMSVNLDRDVSSPSLAATLGLPGEAKLRFVAMNAAHGKIEGAELWGGKLGLLAVAGTPLETMPHPAGGKAAIGEAMLSIRVPNVAAVEARLKAHGVPPLVAAHQGATGSDLTVLDPEGNRVVVYSLPPGRPE